MERGLSPHFVFVHHLLDLKGEKNGWAVKLKTLSMFALTDNVPSIEWQGGKGTPSGSCQGLISLLRKYFC